MPSGGIRALPRLTSCWRKATCLSALTGSARPTEAFPEANRNISRAFEIEPQLAEAHATAAAVAFLFDWDWAAAEREWAIAESLPSGALPTQERVSHSMGRWVLGGPADALRVVRTLRALDPLTVSYAVLEADYLFHAGQLAAAAALYQKTIDDEPTQTRCSAWPRSGISKGASTRRSTCGAAPTSSRATTGCWMRSRRRVVKRAIARSTGWHSNRSSTCCAPARPRPTSRRSTLPGRMRSSATGRRRSATSTRHSPIARRGWSFSRWTPHGTVSATIRASPRQSGASVFLDGPCPDVRVYIWARSASFRGTYEDPTRRDGSAPRHDRSGPAAVRVRRKVPGRHPRHQIPAASSRAHRGVDPDLREPRAQPLAARSRASRSTTHCARPVIGRPLSGARRNSRPRWTAADGIWCFSTSLTAALRSPDRRSRTRRSSSR